MLNTKKKPRRASGAKRLLRVNQTRPVTNNVITSHDYCNTEGCGRCLAGNDGRILGTLARTRLKPANDALTEVYKGLLYYHILRGARDFKESFHFWNRSL